MMVSWNFPLGTTKNSIRNSRGVGVHFTRAFYRARLRLARTKALVKGTPTFRARYVMYYYNSHKIWTLKINLLQRSESTIYFVLESIRIRVDSTRKSKFCSQIFLNVLIRNFMTGKLEEMPEILSDQ